MLRRFRSSALLVKMTWLLVAICPALPVHAQTPIEVITYPGPQSVSMTRNAVRALFTMRQRTWPNGRQVRVFVFPDDSSEHLQFCRDMLGTYPYVLRSVWDRLVFTGTGFAPEVVHSVEEMRTRVGNTPGAIGYLPVQPDPLAFHLILNADLGTVLMPRGES